MDPIDLGKDTKIEINAVCREDSVLECGQKLICPVEITTYPAKTKAVVTIGDGIAQESQSDLLDQTRKDSKIFLLGNEYKIGNRNRKDETRKLEVKEARIGRRVLPVTDLKKG